MHEAKTWPPPGRPCERGPHERGEKFAAWSYNALMVSNRVRAVAPRGERSSPSISTDRAVLTSFEEDAARSRGEAAGVVRPRSEADVAELLERASREGR